MLILRCGNAVVFTYNNSNNTYLKFVFLEDVIGFRILQYVWLVCPRLPTRKVAYRLLEVKFIISS
jgi:hypothetical protein